MLPKSKASPYNITLILSFVLSDYNLKLTDSLKIKLKMYNRNYDGFDYVRIHSELLASVSAERLFNFKP